MMEQLPQWREHVPEGWRPIVDDLHAELLAIAPNYGVIQVKVKFGELRVTAGDRSSVLFSRDGAGGRVIEAAMERARVTCEVCGETGVAREGMTTRCDQHAEGRQAVHD